MSDDQGIRTAVKRVVCVQRLGRAADQGVWMWLPPNKAEFQN